MNEYPQPNDLNQLRTMSDNALRELLWRSIAKSVEAAEARKALVERMRQDAAIFAEQMRAAGARTDVVTNTITVERGGFFGGTEYRDVEYPAWFIRKDTNYGGNSMNMEEYSSYAHRPITHFSSRRIAILQTGELVICNSGSNPNSKFMDFNYNPESPGAEGDFVGNKIDDRPHLAQRAYAEWVSDLEAAAKRYTGIKK